MGIGLVLGTSFALTAWPLTPAQAVGGIGGSLATEGPGGEDAATGAGGAGQNTLPAAPASGGGGGGAGQTGGSGAAGGSGAGGGDGGLTAGAGGTAGAASSTGGAGGGGGGAHGAHGSALPSTAVTGGAGGAGGTSTSDVGRGGGGGAGGWGAVITGSGNLGTLSSSVTGGAGGAGGLGFVGGGGGSGGHGLVLTSGGAATINAAVTGGTGGAAGRISSSGPPGAGGSGIVGGGLGLVLGARVSGGLGGDGTTRANAITFTGGTNTLALAAGWGLTGNVAVEAGSLDLQAAADAQIASSFTGAGNLAMTGTTTLTVTGDILTTGTLAIEAGTLQIGNGGGTGSLNGVSSITNGAALVYNRTGTTTTSASISGAGSVSVMGGGTVILTGENTYSGGTTIAASSTLQVGDGGATGSLGASAISNSGTLAFDRTGNVTHSGLISGTGSVTIARGTLYLTADNTYSGGTTIAAGTYLRVGDGGSTGSLGTGAVVNNHYLTINRTGQLTVANDISGTGLYDQTTGTVILTGTNTYSGSSWIRTGATLQVGDGGTTGTLGSGNVVNSGALVFNRSNSVTVGNVIIGPGTLSQTGAGTLILTSNNAYTGATTIAAGATLQLGAGGTTGSLGSGSLTNAGTLAFNRADSVTYAAVLSGTGGLSQLGTGTLILAADNTYTGTTAIAPGARLQVGNGGTTGQLGSGAVTNNGVLALNRSGGSFPELANVISGTGALEVEGGNFYLTGDSTYSGGTRVAAGAGLSIGKNGTSGRAGTGAIENNGLLALYRSDRHVVANDISGTGVVTQGGAGTAVLTGSNTYSGTTTINSGFTLQVGEGGLTGSLGSGAVVNSGSLVFNRAGQLTQSGVISGAGELRQEGPGELILSGVQSYTGASAVLGGTLTVTGSIASSSGLSVAAGATVGGSGTLPVTVVASGGTIQPTGTSTLNVSGNLTLDAGATAAFAVRATAAGRIAVTGSAVLLGGVRVSPGGTVFNAPYTLITASAITGTPSFSTSASFGAGLTAALSQTATEVTLTLTPAPLVPDEPGPVAPAPAAPRIIAGQGLSGFLPANLRAAGRALDAARKSGADLQPFFGVYAAPVKEIGNAVNQLTGEVSTASGAMGLMAGQQFLLSMLRASSQDSGAMGTRIAAHGSADGDDGTAVPRPRYAMWGQAMGGYSRIEGESGAGSTTRSTRAFGFAMGLDVALGAESLLGVAVGAGETNATLTGGLGSARAWTGQFGVYGRTRLGSPLGGLTLEGAASISLLDVESKRTQYFLGSAQQRAEYDARVYSFRLEGRHDGLRRDGLRHDGLRMRPFLAVQAQVVDSDGFTERSHAAGPSTGLRVAGATNSTVRTELGTQFEGRRVVRGRAVRGFARLAWAHYLMREQTASAGFVALPGSGFSVIGARPDADAALMTLGAEAELAPGWTLGARLDGELSRRVSEVSGTVRLRYAF